MKSRIALLAMVLMLSGCRTVELTPIQVSEPKNGIIVPPEKELSVLQENSKVTVQIGNGIFGSAEEVTILMNGQKIIINDKGVFIFPESLR